MEHGTHFCIYIKTSQYPLKNYFPSFVMFLVLVLVASLKLVLKNNPTSIDPTFVRIYYH